MTILAVATSISEIDFGSGTSATTSTGIDTTYVREGVNIPPSGFARKNFSALSEGWVHFRYFYPSTTNANDTLQVWKLFSTGYSVANPLFQLDYDGTASNNNGTQFGFGVIEYWDSAAFIETNAETLTGIARGSAVNIDIHFKLDNTVGYIVVYFDGVEQCRYDGDTIFTAATTVDRLEVCNVQSGSGVCYVSEIIIADEDTRGMRLVSLAPTGNGANTAFNGAFGDVDETGTDDTDYITSAAANDIETYTAGDIAAGLAGYDVLALAVVARAKIGLTGPQNLQGALRISSTNYFSSNVSGINLAYNSVMAIWTQDPATVANWTQASVNGLEFGLKSIT